MLVDSPVTIPTVDTAGVGEHPVVHAIERWAPMLGKTGSDIARALKVRPQAVYAWVKFAKADPAYLMPAEQVPPLCAYLHLPPHSIRPDLWPSATWKFDDAMTIYLRSQNYRRSGL